METPYSDAQLFPVQELIEEEVTYTNGNFKIIQSNQDWQIIKGVVILINYESITTTFKSRQIMPFCAHAFNWADDAHVMQPHRK
jgi:hypothetical protein